MTDTTKKIIISGLGTGYLPIASGTWASMVVAGLFLAACMVWQGYWPGPVAVMLVVAVAASIACVALGRFSEQAYGRKDPSQCTLDEWAGQALTYLLMLPLAVNRFDEPTGWLIVTAAGFLTFRAMDIAKPPPIRRLEHLPFGWGVLLDDLLAGVYAAVACYALALFLLPHIQ